jgi:cation diffusion facilitator family transporter
MGMLLAKTAAWWWTGSTAILSDAAESVIHVIAVGFAAFSLRLAQRPATNTFLYGFERISFFSAGVEGAMIAVAGLVIIVTAVHDWLTGVEIRRLGEGTLIVVTASLVNLLLGWHLIRTGRATHNIILEANGRHVLSDSWTSFGVVAGLVLVLLTGWKLFDPLCAILVALQILWSGGRLVGRSVKGLMDYADPQMAARLDAILSEECGRRGAHFHHVRFRSTGQRLIVVVHLLFPAAMTLGDAHAMATEIEDAVEARFAAPIEITTHLESIEDHELVHARRPEGELRA